MDRHIRGGRVDRPAAPLVYLIARHRLFFLLLLAGSVVRIVAMLAYRPALWFNDAFEYVSVALQRSPYPIRPNGYSFFLQALQPAHSFALVVGLQHLMGLAIATIIYATARRLGLPAWAGCLVSLPILLDGFWIQLEHTPLSDTLFTLLLVVATSLALRRTRPGAGTCLAIGLVLAIAMLVRPAALPMLALIGLYLLTRRVGWRPLAGFVLALVVPLAGYGLWFKAAHGNLALTNSSGIFLYGRVAGFADCRVIHPATELAPLCPYQPGNGLSAPAWIWHSTSPLYRVPGPLFGASKDRLAAHFALLAIVAQPGAYARAVGRDTLHAFRWSRGPYPNSFTSTGETLRAGPWPVSNVPIAGLRGTALTNLDRYAEGDPRTRSAQPFARWLVAYQRAVHLPGTVLALLLLLGAAGVLPRSRAGEPELRSGLALVELAALSLVFFPILTVQLDYRYVMPSYPFAALAAAIGATRLIHAIGSSPNLAGRGTRKLDGTVDLRSPASLATAETAGAGP